MNKSKSGVVTNIADNHLKITFKGIVTKKELSQIYTDVRFSVADLEEDFGVIADFLECRLMYLNGIAVFRKIFNYLLGSHSGEIIRVIDPDRIITKQIINAALLKKGYKPIYVDTLEEAEEKVKSPTKRDGLRYDLYEQPAEFEYEGEKYSGHILNISTSGCAVTSSSVKLKLGDKVLLKFVLEDTSTKDNFRVESIVIRVESYSFAVRFVSLDSQIKSTLWRCLVELSDGDVR